MLLLLRECVIVCWLIVKINSKPYNEDGNTENGIRKINAKDYIPLKEQLLDGNDKTMILSKLSAVDLINILSQQERNNFLVNMVDKKQIKEFKNTERINEAFDKIKSNLQKDEISLNRNHPNYRLENIQVNTETLDSKYAVFQKLTQILNERSQVPRQRTEYENNDDSEQLLFDLLLTQINSLCCNKHIYNSYQKNKSFKEKHRGDPHESLDKKSKRLNVEHMFVIVNDDIVIENTENKLVSVDPSSLNANSSVLVLGPLQSALSDNELLNTMNQVAEELSAPEYLPILTKLSNGQLEEIDKSILQNLIAGPQTRRYIKPHRCNYQAKLSKVFGGPRWIVCTGYLNLNTPSLYD